MSDTAKNVSLKTESPDTPVKNNNVKGILWGIVYAIAAAIYLAIPTKLIVTYWIPLNELELNGQPIYTLALFMLFLYIISIVISVIYIAAMLRAFIQRKNPELGIPRAVQGVAIVTNVVIITFMIIWFFITGGEIAFFSMMPP